jgi:predicted secreted protein
MSIKGERGILYIWDDRRNNQAYRPVACLTSNGLNSTLSVIESTTKCFPGVVKKTPGTFSYSLDAEGEYIDTTTIAGDDEKTSHDELFLIQKNKDLVIWKLDTDIETATSVKYYGYAYITDLSATFGSGDEVTTFSLTLDGEGEILLTDPND